MNDSITLLKFTGLIQSGLSCDQAISQLGEIPGNPSLRFLLEVARETGSSVNVQISQIVEQYRFRERALARIEIHRAGPSSTSSLLIWLPVVILSMAQLSGFDILGSLSAKPFLLLSIVAGLSLLAIARLVASRLVRRATPAPSATGLYLLGLVMHSTASGSLNQIQNRCLDLYLEAFGSLPSERELAVAAEVTQLAEATGAPLAGLLLSHAEIMQRHEYSQAESQIERLSVRLVIPLGLLVLPAFLLIAIVPISFSMLGSR